MPSHVDLGKSDPFVVFTLDGQRVYKSQTKKKTLHPEWKETFTVTVVSVAPGHLEYVCMLADNDDSALSRYGRLST